MSPIEAVRQEFEEWYCADAARQGFKPKMVPEEIAALRDTDDTYNIGGIQRDMLNGKWQGWRGHSSRVAPLVEGVGQPDSVHVAGAQDVGSASEEWSLVRVNAGFFPLIDALDRAERKGYLPDALGDEWAAFHWENALAAPRFDKTFCSQCGGEFGPGDEGFSHCSDHRAAHARTTGGAE